MQLEIDFLVHSSIHFYRQEDRNGYLDTRCLCDVCLELKQELNPKHTFKQALQLFEPKTCDYCQAVTPSQMALILKMSMKDFLVLLQRSDSNTIIHNGLVIRVVDFDQLRKAYNFDS